MKSKSPFAKKSPLRVQVYGGDTYESPDTVITKTVGEQVGKAITELADNVVDYMDSKGKLATKNKNGFDKFLNTEKPKLNTSDYKGDLRTVGGFEERKVPGKKSIMKLSEMTPEQKSWREQKINELGPEGYAKLVGKNKSKDVTQKRTYTLDNKGNKVFDVWKQKNNLLASNTNKSPNKLIGDTMDPSGQINPGAVPPNQAQNDLGAQPIISAEGSQPSARTIDMAAIGNPYATPGADFDPQSKMKAESIFGSAEQRQGLMNLRTPQ